MQRATVEDLNWVRTLLGVRAVTNTRDEQLIRQEYKSTCYPDMNNYNRNPCLSTNHAFVHDYHWKAAYRCAILRIWLQDNHPLPNDRHVPPIVKALRSGLRCQALERVDFAYNTQSGHRRTLLEIMMDLLNEEMDNATRGWGRHPAGRRRWWV